jgi:DNA-binding NarL/FixJ family response regulator
VFATGPGGVVYHDWLQELAVLEHAAQGRTSAAISTSLHISETTVKTYLSCAFDKLGVSDRTSAVRQAFKLGLID